MGALALGARLRERDAHLPIIFITAPHLARSETKRMHAIGQMVLPHRFRPAQLVDSVRRAIAATSSAPKPQVLPDPLDGALKLTPRERQVLALRLRGLAVKEVARQLGIATGTVGTHCQRLLRKYRVRSLTEFVLRHVIARTWPRR
jgi:DNA-binding NarL/FixJ family response regulator